jgi:hypothetical protein
LAGIYGIPLAAAIYGLNLMTVNALGTLLWFYASSRPGIIADEVSPRAIRFVARLRRALQLTPPRCCLRPGSQSEGRFVRRGDHIIRPAESFPGAAIGRIGIDVTVVVPPRESRRSVIMTPHYLEFDPAKIEKRQFPLRGAAVGRDGEALVVKGGDNLALVLATAFVQCMCSGALSLENPAAHP